MKKTIFGKTGLKVAPLGFGGAPVGFLKTDQAKVASMLNAMLDAGANVIDTAAMYEGSEELIGEAVGHRRKDYVLVTKCGQTVNDCDAPAWSAKVVTHTINRALKRLRTDVLDVMLLHSCDLETLKRGDALAAVLKARDAGKVRFAGYSGDNEVVAYAASLPEIAVVEASISMADQANIDLLLPVARHNNVGVIAKRPIANAAWKPIAQQPGLYQGYAKTYHDRLAAMKLSPVALGVPGMTRKTLAAEAWPQVAMRFTLSQPGVNVAIIGTTNPDNMKANLAYASMGPLPDGAVAKIRKAFRDAEAASGTRWSGQI